MGRLARLLLKFKVHVLCHGSTFVPGSNGMRLRRSGTRLGQCRVEGTSGTTALVRCREALSQVAVHAACAVDREGVQALLAGLPEDDAAVQLATFDAAVDASLAAVATFAVRPYALRATLAV